MPDPTIQTSLLEITPAGAFPGAIQFDSPGGGALTLRGPSGPVSLSLTLPVTTPNPGDYLRANGGGQLYWDAGCGGCGGGGGTGGGGGITDPGTNGLLVRTDANTYVTRSIVSGAGSPITVTNGDGVAGNIVLGLIPGDTNGQVLTWDATSTPPHWKAAAGGGVSAGGGGTPNFLTRWLTGTTLQDSALSQDATGTTVNAGGDFVVSGKLKTNTLLQFAVMAPGPPPGGFASLASIYYQGGSQPLWISYGSTSSGGIGYQPINAVQLGSAGGAFGPMNKIIIGRTGGLIGDGGGVGGGAGFTGPFEGEIYLTPGTAAGQVMLWNGSAWGPGGGSSGVGSGVSLGVTQGQINTIPIWTGTNFLGNSLILQEGAAPITYVRVNTDLYVSNGYVRTDKYLDLTNTVLPPTGATATARIAYGVSAFPNSIVASINGLAWAPINAVTMKGTASSTVTNGTWQVVVPLDISTNVNGEGLLRIAPGGTDGYVLTWVGGAQQGSWQARPPGGTGSGITGSGGASPFIPLWTSPTTQSVSTLTQNTTGDIATTGFLTGAKGLKAGQNGFFETLAYQIPGGPNVNIPTSGQQARIVLYQNQLLVSISGSTYAPLGVSALPATGTANTVPLWTSSSTLANSSLTQDPGGYVYFGQGAIVNQKVRTGQFFEFAPLSPGQTYTLSDGGTAKIIFNQALNAARILRQRE